MTYWKCSVWRMMSKNSCLLYTSGEEQNVGKIIAGFTPKKVLVHFGGQSARKSGLLDRVEKALEAEGIAYVELGGVTANPELKLVREGIALCQREGVDFVLAVGGGSVLDSSKAVSYTHLDVYKRQGGAGKVNIIYG